MFRRAAVILQIVYGLMALTAGQLAAQTNLSTIRGMVTDSSGGAVPIVSVKLVNEVSGFQRIATTDETGNYEFAAAAQGTYSLEAEKAGFKKTTVRGYVLRSGLTVRLDLTMEVGELASSVEVRGVGEALVQTDTGTRQTYTSAEMLKGLPNSGSPARNFLISTLFAMPIHTSNQDGINGVKTANYSFNLNGVDVSSAQPNLAYIHIPIEAVEETKVTYNSGSAETGFGAAQINVIGKRGTNNLHGSLFEFYQSNLWAARNAFSVGSRIPRFNRHEYGFTVGGPVVLPKLYNGRNKTFFFAAWDNLVTRGTQGIAVGSSPTVKMRSGDFSEIGFPLRDPLSGTTLADQTSFPNGVIPASRIPEYARKQWATKLGDLPNVAGLTANLRQPPGPGNNLDGAQRWAVRLDQNLGSKDVVTVNFNGLFKYLEQYQDRCCGQTKNIIRNLPNSPNYNLGGQWVHIFAPNLTADSTFNYRYMLYRQEILPNGDALWYKTNGVKPPPGLVEKEDQPWTLYGPIFQFSGTGPVDRFGPYADNPVVRDDSGVFFAERLAYIRGKHTIKFGPELKFEKMTPDFTGNWRGTFAFVGDRNSPLSTGWASADYLLGLANNVSYRARPALRQPRVARPRFAAYAQDEWKATPKLTLNYGLRWEYIAPLTEEADEMAQFDLDSNKLIIAGSTVPSGFGQDFAGIPLASASSVGLGRNLWVTPKRNFTPRVSVAYRPFGGTRTVFRAGYGMYYQDEGLSNQYAAAQSAPFVYSLRAVTEPGPGRITWDNPFPTASIQKQSFSTRPREWPVERFQQWNVTIEREIGWNAAISVGYLGSRVGLGSIGINRNFPLAASRNPNGTFNFVRPFADANDITYQSSEGYYRSHSLQVEFRRRMAQGLTFDGTYLWQKGIDNGWPSGFSGPLKYLAVERGLSPGTRKAAFVSRFVWDLPIGQQRLLLGNMNRALDAVVGGWTLAGILTANTGTYFNPTFNNSLSSFGVSGNRPDAVPGRSFNQDVPPGLWFNPAAFAVPALPTGGEITFGNVSRNIIPGPGVFDFNLTMSKFFRIYESHRLEMRAESFNAFNHVNLNRPAANISDPNTVGKITGSGTSRYWRFALRYEF